MVSSDPWPLVGRDAELSRVAEILATAAASGIVLAGPGGVGKSRLARECATLAEGAGYRVARALATRSASHIPLGALATVLSSGDDAPDGLTGARAAISALAQERPLLLLVDDAHLLDDVSATVLLSGAEDPRVFPLLTVRTGEPGPDAVTALWKDAGAVRVDLEPIDERAVAELLREVLGGPVDPVAAGRLAHLSGGGPLALRELVDGALGDGVLSRVDGCWSLAADPKVPARLAELIGARLDRLGAGTTGLLAALALTEPLPVAAVERLGLLQDLEVLEAQRLVSITDDAGGRSVRSPVTGSADGAHGLSARLDHPLYGEVALDRTGELQRRRLLAGCAAAVDAGDPGPRGALRTVLWRLWAGEQLEIDSLTGAALHSYLVGDYVRTRELAEAAWQLDHTFDAGHLLGFALGRGGRSREADGVLADAATAAATDREVALVTITRSEIALRGLGDPQRAEDLCLAAEAALSDPAWRAEVTAHRAMGLVQRGALLDALELLRPILDDTDPPPRALVKAAYAAGIALVHGGSTEEATAVALRALPVHESVWTDGFFQTEPGVHHLTTIFAMIGSGRYGEVAPILAFARDLTRGALPRYGHAWICFLSGMAAVHQGQVRDALTHFGTAAPIFQEGDQAATESWCRAGAALAEAMRGDAAAASQHLQEVDRLAVSGLELNRAWVAEARGWTAVARGQMAEAHALFDAEADVADARGDCLGAARLLHSLARSGAAASAVERLDALCDRTGQGFTALQARHARLLAARDSTGLGESNDSLAEEFASVGAFLHAAEAAADASRAHRRAGEQRVAARSTARSREILSHCQGARTPLTLLPASHEPLTARERDVARMAADRLSSKEIAHRLGLSSRTVDNHLQRAYRKLGVSTRTDLAEVLDAPAG